MIAFRFRVNRSFLRYASHPITVPKSQVDYVELPRHGFGTELEVISHEGRTLCATLYHGNAGYGPYYQIRMSESRDAFRDLSLGEDLNVELDLIEGRTRARLALAEG